MHSIPHYILEKQGWSDGKGGMTSYVKYALGARMERA